MSKAFTKDDAQGEPIVVPARAPLPAGTPNYVTPRGLARLETELGELHALRAAAVASGVQPAAGALAARVAALEERIAGAMLVGPPAQHDEVRFGAVVDVRMSSGVVRRYQIVGVDEADAAHGLLAFVSPIARALLGKGVGDVAVVRTPRGEEEIEVLAIA